MRLCNMFLALTLLAPDRAAAEPRRPEAAYALDTLAESLARAEKVVVYRGVPRKSEPRPWEVKGTPVELDGGRFAPEPVVVSAADVKILSGLLGTKSFLPFPVGTSRCLTYHPEYAMEWKSGGDVHRIQFCFSCNEFRVYKGEAGAANAARLSAEGKVNTEPRETNARDQFRRTLSAYFRSGKGR